MHNQPRFDTLHINLWGPPCTGKTGVADELAGKLSKNGFVVERVHEYAKKLAWQGQLEQTDQFLISAEQYKRQLDLDGLVPIIITDAPLLVGTLYAKPEDHAALHALLKNRMSQFNNYHVLLERDMRHSYQPLGRSQKDVELSLQQKPELERLLNQDCRGFVRIPVEQAVDTLFDVVANHLNKIKCKSLRRSAP